MARNSVFEYIFKNLPTIRRIPREAQGATATFRPTMRDYALPVPSYRDHLDTLYDQRLREDSRDLLADMFKNDPDVSAAVGGYLTMADTRLTMVVRDDKDHIDVDATEKLQKIVRTLTRQTDFKNGFVLKPNLQMFCQELRWMLLLRGAIGAELIFDSSFIPQRIQQVDMKSIFWFEQESGIYKPQQRLFNGAAQGFIDLDIPTFFVAYHRRDVTDIYPKSDFVSVINTAAARQLVINELFRIMQVSGFPRISLKVLEDVLVKNAPVAIRDDANQLQAWARARLGEVAASFANIRSDQPFAHFDSVEPSVINDKAPGMAVDISKVIDVLNAQNQAALKTMATVIGRGNGTTGVASVEARIAAMNADQLNVPVKQLLDQLLTFALNAHGVQGFVDCRFDTAELRPATELEPQMVLRSSRLKQDLSLGIITDEEYTMAMYNRLPHPDAPKLSGTNFNPAGGPEVRTDDVSPNQGSLDRSMVPEGGDMARSNGVKAALALLSTMVDDQ
jgi:hypothetical protein